jgi:hypothetical protein
MLFNLLFALKAFDFFDGQIQKNRKKLPLGEPVCF